MPANCESKAKCFRFFLPRTANASEAHRQRISRHCHFPEFVRASFLKFKSPHGLNLAVTEYATDRSRYTIPLSLMAESNRPKGHYRNVQRLDPGFRLQLYAGQMTGDSSEIGKRKG